MTDNELINRLLTEFPPRPDRTGKLLLDAERAAQADRADDIVTRLTEPNAGVTSDQWAVMRRTMSEAAAEIKRLRALVDGHAARADAWKTRCQEVAR